jgi:hypothetical protein
VPTRVATSYVVRTRVVQSCSKEVQFLPTCCEQIVTYLVIGISDLELESTFLDKNLATPVENCGFGGVAEQQALLVLL